MTATPSLAILGLNFPPEPSGNSPYTGALALALSGRGYDVRVMTAHPHYPEWRVRDGYGGWRRTERSGAVEIVRHRHYVPRSPRGLRRLLSEISFGVRLMFARWNRPDVVLAVSPALFSTWLASWRKGRTPMIIWVQDIYTLGLAETGEGGGIAARVIKWVESRTLRSAARVVVIHPRFRDYLIENLGVDDKRVSIIRNWTHLAPSEAVDRTGARATRGWLDHESVVVHAGNMGVKQGLENVVDAARLADERGLPVRFVLLGGGGERERLMESAHGVERIEFIDSLPDHEFRAALAAADVLLVNEKPGVAAMAVPSKLTSYFDAGRPVIAATSVDGITASELAASGGGIVVAAGKAELLLDAVLTLASDHKRSEDLGRAGRVYREQVLSEDAAFDHWARLVDDVIDRNVSTMSTQPE